MALSYHNRSTRIREVGRFARDNLTGDLRVISRKPTAAAVALILIGRGAAQRSRVGFGACMLLIPITKHTLLSAMPKARRDDQDGLCLIEYPCSPPPACTVWCPRDCFGDIHLHYSAYRAYGLTLRFVERSMMRLFTWTGGGPGGLGTGAFSLFQRRRLSSGSGIPDCLKMPTWTDLF